MNKIVKTFLGLLLVLIPAAVVIGLLFNNITQKSFYEETGDLRINGINNEVKIYNDEYGIPHIFSQSGNDAFFTLGYLHARDRLWQMDLTRRAAEGRLSEIFGSKTISADKYFKTIGLGRLSYVLYKNASPKTKEILNAYSNGINAFIEKNYHAMPLEFDALNYKPEPWIPEHSLMIGRLMGWQLNLSSITDYVIGSIVSKTGLEKAREIFPDTTHAFYKKPLSFRIPDSTKIIDSLQKLDSLPWDASRQLKEHINTQLAFHELMKSSPSHAGSNAWVLSGSKTNSGKTILSNDPHLSLLTPSYWYEAMIRSNEFEIRGMTIPGIPIVLIGNTRFIAWGLTSLMNDETDYAVLQRDSSDARKYIRGGNSFYIDSLKEIIRVKDTSEVEYMVYRTQDGPIVSEQIVFEPLTGNERYRVTANNDKIISMKWTGYELGDEILSFYNMSISRNWDEFKAALKGIANPSFNVVYNDANGNIGYHAAGKIPIRTGAEFEEIYPKGEPGWTGFIEFERLPNLFNPPEGFIMSANNNPFTGYNIPEPNRFYLSYLWESSSRFDKGKEFINSRTKFDIEDMKLLQMNYESKWALNIVQFLIKAFNNFPTNDVHIMTAIDLFRKWNGDMIPREAVGLIFNKFTLRLLKNIYLDEMGTDVFSDFLIVSNIPLRSVEILLRNYDSTNTGWIDDISSVDTETLDDILRKSLIEAIEELKAEMPTPDMSAWSWSEKHKTIFKHPLGIVQPLDKSVNIGPYETGGHNTTLNNGEYSLYHAYRNGDYSNVIGPSMRLIVDFYNIDNTLSVNSTGQSGQPLHKNYQNQSRLWAYGDYKINKFTESEMIIARFTVMRLLPR